MVIEGWNTLVLQDDRIGPLLASPYIGLLRRFRNGVFHFQRRYWDERILGLVREGAASAAWVHDVHAELGRALLAMLRCATSG